MFVFSLTLVLMTFLHLFYLHIAHTQKYYSIFHHDLNFLSQPATLPFFISSVKLWFSWYFYFLRIFSYGFLLLIFIALTHREFFFFSFCSAYFLASRGKILKKFNVINVVLYFYGFLLLLIFLFFCLLRKQFPFIAFAYSQCLTLIVLF